jgi:hypothetical protein
MVFVLHEEIRMRTFTWVSGRLTEVHRFINVPMRWCEQYPARERRELWLSTAERRDIKLVVHARLMPARCGHEVVCVLHDGQLVGLCNLSTEGQVNFISSDPPLLWRRCDGARVAALFLIAFFSWCVASWPLVGAIMVLWALLHGPCTLGARWLQRGLMKRATQHALASAARQATARPPLWRVK